MAYKIKSLLLLFLVCYCIDVQSQSKKQSRAYYFSFNGNDLNEGTVTSPYKSIGKIKDLELKQGDSILFKAKEVFIGNLLFENIIHFRQKQLDEIQKYIKFLKNLVYPNVSLSEIKPKGKNYIVIKGSYQIIDEQGNKNRMSVFVGRKDEFPEGKNDERAKAIATEKILLLLQNKFFKK
jgi:hypothetical protein